MSKFRMVSLPLVFLLAAGGIFLFVYNARRIVKIIFFIVFILSSINILSLWNGIKAYPVDAIISIDGYRESVQKASYKKQDSNVLVILFDELSYDYIYEQNKIKPQYHNIKTLSLASDNYHNASSPGKESLTAIIGFLMGERFDSVQMKDDGLYTITPGQEAKYLSDDSNNIFAFAKNIGYRTFCFGAYLPYVELFGQWLDGGRSFSVYNYGNLQQKLRFYNPFFTTIILLPHQFPYGILKNPIYSLWQKRVVDQTLALVMRAINSREPFFIFAHFYVPHLPFTFNKDGYYHNRKPFLENNDNYSKQLDYVDKLVGHLIIELKNKGKFDNSTIVLLADHNYRIMLPGRERAIPLIIKHKGQKTYIDIGDSVRAEEILKKDLFIQ